MNSLRHRRKFPRKYCLRIGADASNESASATQAIFEWIQLRNHAFRLRQRDHVTSQGSEL